MYDSNDVVAIITMWAPDAISPLVHLSERALGLFQGQPGFLGGTLLVGTDRSSVVLHQTWESVAACEAGLDSPDWGDHGFRGFMDDKDVIHTVNMFSPVVAMRGHAGHFEPVRYAPSQGNTMSSD